MKNIPIIDNYSKFVVSAAEMRRCDQTTIDHFKVPQDVLMERAALSLCEEIRKHADPGERILIYAGSGNNGGDGIAAARLLFQDGYDVRLVLVNHLSSKCSDACTRQLKIAEKYGVKAEKFSEDQGPDGRERVIVDAMLGIGCSRDLAGEYLDAVLQINGQTKAYIVAADIPTGINADNGAVCGECVHADCTVTFGYAKLGLLMSPGRENSGEIIIRQVGITEDGYLNDYPKYRYIEKMAAKDMCKRILPQRRVDGNKGTFGKVLIAAGSRGCSGALVMAAESAIRSGAGMVRVFTEKTNLVPIQTLLPEAMSDIYDESEISSNEKEIADSLIKALAWADAIVCGPGMGIGESGYLILKTILENTDKALLLDADALNLIADREDLRDLVKEYPGEKIMTPHLAEFGRLCKKTALECKKDILTLPAALAKEFNASMICKDARSIITDGKRHYINVTGNDGMATAGSGDVLSGLLGAFMCMPFADKFEAAVAGCYFHGAAGDLAASKNGRRGMTARDISLGLREIFTME